MRTARRRVLLSSELASVVDIARIQKEGADKWVDKIGVLYS
jgi:hypothetical protein